MHLIAGSWRDEYYRIQGTSENEAWKSAQCGTQRAPTGPRNVQIRPVALASTGLPTEQTRRRLDSVIQSPRRKTARSSIWGPGSTLANSNGVSFPSAHTQIVAGRVNRESGEVEPIDAGGPVLAECWPRGSTSDPPELLQIARAIPAGFGEHRSHGVISLPRLRPVHSRKSS